MIRGESRRVEGILGERQEKGKLYRGESKKGEESRQRVQSSCDA